MARRRGSAGVSVTVDVDIDDVLDEMSDAELREYCEERDIIPKTPANALQLDGRAQAEDFAEELWAAFRAQDATHFRVLLHRMLPPYPPLMGSKKQEEKRA
jgi:hypothetical protein